jgi:hypothetical protein
MSYLSTPQPDEPNPPGVTPNKPKEPSVYGGRWGNSGGHKPGRTPPPDRPERIEPPNPQDEPQQGPTAPPSPT